MADAGAEDERLLKRLKPSEFTPPRRKPAWYWMAAAAALLVAAFLGWHWSVETPHPEQLLARAYEQARPFEYRWLGSRHAPVRQDRSVGAVTTQALREARAAIASNTSDPDFLGRRGQAELLGLELAAAVETLRAARERAPADRAVRRSLAIALAVQGANDKARLEEALELLRDDPSQESRFNRALILERLERRDEARAQWDECLRDERDPGWRREAEQRRAASR
jgi:tetratricopeptide (TPR) repeat protein